MSEYRDKLLTLDNMNPYVRKMKFAEDPVASRAIELRRELSEGIEKPFNDVIELHTADGHAFVQKPLTFLRQIISLVLLPELFNDPAFPEDVKSKAKTFLNGCRNRSIGSYSDSPGVEIVRNQIAKFIEDRDGVPSCWNRIVCSNGATDIIRLVLNLFPTAEGFKTSGIIIPVPEYPLYVACISELNLHPVKYYLNEEKNWAVDIGELKRAIDEERKHCKPRALVVINPGNPTGQVLTKENIENIIVFAYRENLFILADEVNQDNVYAPDREFISVKKVMMEMGPPYNDVQLASFMSGSKGFTGESGFRAGCVEMTNVDPEVVAMLVKTIASATCPTVLGQAVMYCVANRPKPGDPSFAAFNEEKSAILNALELNARIVQDALNSITGYSCQAVQGGISAYPSIQMPIRAIAAAKQNNQDASELYAIELLESTGVCVSPGCCYGQRPDRFHIRLSILQHPNVLREALRRIKDFHSSFYVKYS